MMKGTKKCQFNAKTGGVAVENINDKPIEIEKEQRSISGIAIGFALGIFLFWLTIKAVQVVSAL